MIVSLLHNDFSKELWISREEGCRMLFTYQAGVSGVFAGVARTYLYRVI
jgi:phage shock protein PspC (stress-responsive transcriptional regulator)